MNPNLQPGIHPDADELSVFVEGAATPREQEKMLAHLAECAECRKAVFLMQPHEEPQRVTPTPEKAWMWRWLVPVGLSAAALACGLIVMMVYLRPHGASEAPQQVASVRQSEIERPGPGTAALTTNSDKVARSESPNNTFAPNAKEKDKSPQNKHVANVLNSPSSQSVQAGANVAPQAMGAAPSVIGGPVPHAATVSGGISSGAISDLPLNGRNVAELQQLQPADTKKEPPALPLQHASAQNETLAGISGRITDPTGAAIAGVTVTLRDASGQARQTMTGTDGSFHLTQLPAGQYGLTATARGFKTSQQSIELKPSELAMLQAVLDVGAVSETVEVVGASGVVQTESASLSSRAGAELSSTRQVISLPSAVPVTATVSHGKRFLSLDDAGNLFLSRNEGKKWKKVKPQWAGKAIRIELTSGSVSEDVQKPKDENSGAAGEAGVFLLTTDGGTVWSSEDGAHWHQR